MWTLLSLTGRDKPTGQKGSETCKIQVCVLMAQINSQTKHPWLESAHKRRENSSDTKVSLHFLELPPTASCSGNHPHHQLQLKESGHKGVFNSESKRSETPNTKMITKLWWNCKVLQQTKEEPQSTLKLQIVTCKMKWRSSEARKKLKEEQKSNGVESNFGDKEICSE